MKKLPYIEDYILLMVTDMLVWPPTMPLIKLARYDEPIVNSMAQQINSNLGFTDKQAVLAHKIVIKYRKQWAANNYDVSDHDPYPKFKIAIRTIDRSKSIGITNQKIYLRFPYDQDLISEIRASVQNLPGQIVFNKEHRQWEAALIEPRIIWAKEFGLKHKFNFDTEFNTVINTMLAQEEYSISLMANDTGYYISNAEHSMIQYIEDHAGIQLNNLAQLVDLAPLLGYTVDTKVMQQFNTEVAAGLHDFYLHKDHSVEYANKSSIDITQVVEYAIMVNRWPIYVYESNDKTLLNLFRAYFDSVVIADKYTDYASLTDAKVIYIKHWKLSQVKIPLLVTMNSLMIGFRRQQMLQCADKIIYFTQKVQENASVPITNT